MTATIARTTRTVRERATKAASQTSPPSVLPSRSEARANPNKELADRTAPLWSRYLAMRDKASFDALVAEYRSYVEGVASRFSKRLPPSVDIDDLVSAGCFGLMDAIGGFDPSRNTRFQTFALKRIVGAMNDYLRSQDIAPRLARRRETQVKRARDDFRKKHGRSPTEEELLRLLHADTDEALAIVTGSEIPCMSSLTAPADDGDTGQTMEAAVSVAADRSAMSSVSSGLFDRDVQKWLGRSLSRSERLIIWLYYFESLTMKEVGQVLGICEGRVSQIHALLLERLRARLSREQDAA